MDTAELSFSIGETLGIAFIITVLIKFVIDYLKKLFIYIGRKYNKWQNISDETWTTLWMVVSLILGVTFVFLFRVDAEETINSVMPGTTLPVSGTWADVAAGVILARSSNILNDLKKPFAPLLKKNGKAAQPPTEKTETEKVEDMSPKTPVSPFDREAGDSNKDESKGSFYEDYKR